MQKKKLGRSIDEEGIITKKLRILRDKGKEFFIAKKKKKTRHYEKAGNFSADERKKVSIRKAGIFDFYFYDKESAKKVLSENGGAFSKRKF